MTDIAALRRDHEQFCTDFGQALADAERLVRRAMADAGDDDPSPSSPAAVRLQRPAEPGGFLHKMLMPAYGAYDQRSVSAGGRFERRSYGGRVERVR